MFDSILFKNYVLYRSGVAIEMAVVVGRVISRSASQKVENITSQHGYTTQLVPSKCSSLLGANNNLCSSNTITHNEAYLQ